MTLQVSRWSTRAKVRLLRFTWTLLGFLGDIAYVFLGDIVARGDGWLGSIPVFYVLFQGATAGVQALWARRNGLRIVAAEYAILVGLGAAAAIGLFFVVLMVDNAPIRMGGIAGIFIVLIAAPFRSLKDAGVRRRDWWKWGLNGSCVAMAVLGLGWVLQNQYVQYRLFSQYPIYFSIRFALGWFASKPIIDAMIAERAVGRDSQGR
ncbi:hypothetical protein EON81_13355 [bacterium]|nr:MAG: hypothetical protein EON81_13355 [bacterium]